jgi:hypothetical protein
MRNVKYALRIGVPLVVAAALVIGFAVPALARSRDDKTPPPTPTARTLQGKVVKVEGTAAFTVQTTSGNVSVSVNATTRYYLAQVGRGWPSIGNNVGNGILRLVRPDLDFARIPANWAENAVWLRGLKTGHFTDITVGSKVVVRVGVNDNMARQVLVLGVKAPVPVIVTVKGALSEVTTRSLTITPVSGPKVILNWDSSTRFTLKGLITVAGGKYATAVYDKGTSKALTVNVLVAAPSP